MAKRKRKSRGYSKDIWAAVKADYELGLCSIRALAEKHGPDEAAIRRRAKAEGWRQQFAAHVEARRRALLLPVVIVDVRADNPQADPTPEQAAKIDDAARTQVAVILGHRRDIRELREVVAAMADELKGQTLHRGALEEMIAEHFAGGGVAGAAIRAGLMQSLRLGTRATALANIVNGMGRLVTLERQAFGMGNMESEPAADPVRRHQEQTEAGEFDGVTDDQRARAMLSLIEKAAARRQQEQQKQATNPGPETKQ